jgi:hypothetical protein
VTGKAVFLAMKLTSMMRDNQDKFPGFLQDAVQKNTIVKGGKQHEKPRLFKIPVVLIQLNQFLALAMPRRPASTLDSPATGSATAEDNVIRFDDAPEFSFRQRDDDSMEDMEQQVKEAQRRLADLRAQQEEVERQKQILEALRQKQERFVSGKKEITDRLERALRSIVDELEEARRRVEDLALTQKDFEDRLDDLKTYLPERWQRSHLDHELDRALSSLQDAEVSYEKGVHRLMPHRAAAQVEPAVMSPIHAAIAPHQEAEDVVHAESVLHSGFNGGGRDDLVSWARRGLAFNAALITALVLLLILARMMF